MIFQICYALHKTWSRSVHFKLLRFFPMSSSCFVIYDFCGSYEQQTNYFFRGKFSSTKNFSKFSEILRAISNVDGISCLIYNNIITYLPHDSLYQLCLE